MTPRDPLILQTREQLQNWRRELRRAGKTLGFVPTMGALHRGHLALVHRAQSENDVVLMSIFVNPTQFGPGEDYAAYPRPFQDDVAAASSAGVHALFAPPADEIYPQGFGCHLGVSPDLGHCLEGKTRPGHFDGVCLVVAILINLCDPDALYIGQKDYQQAVILLTMLREMGMRTRGVVVPTVRDSDGLALSSRNRYLDAPIRVGARLLPGAMDRAAQNYLDGEGHVDRIIQSFESYCAEHILAKGPFEIEYVTALASWSLKPVFGEVCEELVLAAVLRATVFVAGKPRVVRLLDNVILSRAQPWVESLKDLHNLVDSEPLPDMEVLLKDYWRRQGETL